MLAAVRRASSLVSHFIAVRREIDMGKRLSVGVKNKAQSRLKRMMQLVG
jgi:hypothetical protein